MRGEGKEGAKEEKKSEEEEEKKREKVEKEEREIGKKKREEEEKKREKDKEEERQKQERKEKVEKQKEMEKKEEKMMEEQEREEVQMEEEEKEEELMSWTPSLWTLRRGSRPVTLTWALKVTAAGLLGAAGLRRVWCLCCRWTTAAARATRPCSGKSLSAGPVGASGGSTHEESERSSSLTAKRTASSPR